MAVRAVVLLQADDVFDVVIAGELAHIAHFRAAKSVNRLVIVAHGKHRIALARQQLQPLVLQAVGVLEFVHQNVLETLLVMRPQVGIARQQLMAAQQQLGKIHHALALALRIVLSKNRLFLLLVRAKGIHLAGAQALLLVAVDKIRHLTRREFFLIHIHGLHQALDGRLLIAHVQNLESLGQIGLVVMQAQQAVTQTVKRANPQALRMQRQHCRQPGQHLLGGLVGERHRQHTLRRHPIVANQIRNARGQHPRLATPRPGQNQGRAMREGDSFELRGI